MTLLSTVIGERHRDQRNTTRTAGCRYVELSLKRLSSNACVRQLVTVSAQVGPHTFCVGVGNGFTCTMYPVTIVYTVSHILALILTTKVWHIQ
jgi:hypothetical protein